MSDPVKSVEIEDVLSSIRRLLADGEGQGGGRPAPQQSADATGRSPVAPSRVRAERRGDAPLVLTPALRVSGREGAAERPSRFPAPVAANTGTPGAASVDDDFEPADLTAASSDKGGSLRSRLEETIAELESAITHRADEWEPDGSEPAPVMDWSSARAEDTPFLSRRHVGPVSTGRAAPSVPREMQSAPQPQASGPDVEDQQPVSRPETAAEMHEQSAATAPARPQVAEPAAKSGEAAAPTPSPDALVDEDMLRRLITEVLREELRGPLGDRITGNLRKLVRREIFRALASGEFE